MNDRIVVDTNLIVRYLVQDNEKQARAAGRIFGTCDRGELAIVVLPAVLAECVFVLESFYGHARLAIASALTTLISSPGVEIAPLATHLDAFLDALDRYRRTNVHFVDCLIAATASAADIPVASFDREFRKFADVRVFGAL